MRIACIAEVTRTAKDNKHEFLRILATGETTCKFESKMFYAHRIHLNALFSRGVKFKYGLPTDTSAMLVE